VCFGEALQPSFREYAAQVVANAKTLAEGLLGHGFDLVSGGTDNHLILVDLRSKGLTGKLAEAALEHAGITVNKNAVPFDPEKPFVTSGIRVGTAALTTRGMREAEMRSIADGMAEALAAPENEAALGKVAKAMRELADSHPLYPELG